MKNLPVNAGDSRDPGSVPGLGRSPPGGNGNPLQRSCQENSKDRGACWATYCPWGCTESDTTERTHTHILLRNKKSGKGASIPFSVTCNRNYNKMHSNFH